MILARCSVVCWHSRACCKNAVVELNPDGTPKDPQTKEQKKEDPKDLRNAAKAADWSQMRMLLRRMPFVQINSAAAADEGDEDEKGGWVQGIEGKGIQRTRKDGPWG